MMRKGPASVMHYANFNSSEKKKGNPAKNMCLAWDGLGQLTSLPNAGAKVDAPSDLTIRFH